EMDVRPSQAITGEQLGADETAWNEFLAHSVNGTLFHDLHFLRYHPVDRFAFHHLVFKRDGRPVALLPGGLSGTAGPPTFCSPLGASVGGFAVADLTAELAMGLVEALQDYARMRGWAGVEITLPPACYSFATSDLIDFALFCRGFRLLHRWLCPMIPLTADGRDGFERTYRSRQATFVRAAKRKGIVGIESGLDAIDDFLKVFYDTYSRHGTKATHTPEEVRDLLQRFPDRVRIHLAKLGDVPIASLLVFKVTASVAYTFYICSSTEHFGEHGAAFVIADLIDRLAQAGFRYLDLGPSAHDQKFNKGVTFFK